MTIDRDNGAGAQSDAATNNNDYSSSNPARADPLSGGSSRFSLCIRNAASGTRYILLGFRENWSMFFLFVIFHGCGGCAHNLSHNLDAAAAARRPARRCDGADGEAPGRVRRRYANPATAAPAINRTLRRMPFSSMPRVLGDDFRVASRYVLPKPDPLGRQRN